MLQLPLAQAYAQDKLQNSLSPTLFYHGFHHTVDVVAAALRLAADEGITDTHTLALIETAAWYHDIGFIVTYKGHEAEGCRIAEASLPRFGYTDDDIEQICGMIRATKIPQSPENLLEQIIADADLDYLGRDDFEPIAQTLYDELKEREMVGSIADWDKVQIMFLNAHQYFTETANATRKALKERHLAELKRKFA